MKKIFVALMFSVVSLFAFEELNLENFESKLKDKNAIVDFYALWCGPCKIIDRNLKDFEGIKPDNITIYKLNVDEQAMIAQKYKVNRIPALLYFKDGKHVKTTLGVKNVKEILETSKKSFGLQ